MRDVNDMALEINFLAYFELSPTMVKSVALVFDWGRKY